MNGLTGRGCDGNKIVAVVVLGPACEMGAIATLVQQVEWDGNASAPVGPMFV